MSLQRRNDPAILVAFIAVLVSLGSNLALLKVSQEARDRAAETKMALCTFRADLVQTVTGTRDFLETHPQGFAGIPRATLEEGLLFQEAAVKSLRSLEC